MASLEIARKQEETEADPERWRKPLHDQRSVQRSPTVGNQLVGSQDQPVLKNAIQGRIEAYSAAAAAAAEAPNELAVGGCSASTVSLVRIVAERRQW